MKKLFYALSFALVGGLAANAAAPIVSTSAHKGPFKMSNGLEAQTEIQKAYRVDDDITASTRKNVKKKAGLPTDAEAYFGNWQWSSRSRLSGGLPSSGVMVIGQHPVYADSLLVKGFDLFADEVKGGLTAYFKNGKVYIPNQQVLDGTDPDANFATSYFINVSVRNATEAEKAKWQLENPGEDPTGLKYFLDWEEMPKTADGKPVYEFFFALQTSESGTEYISSNYFEDPNAEETDEVLISSFCNAEDVKYTIIKNPLTDKEEFKISGWYLSVYTVTGFILEEFQFDPEDWTEAGIAGFMDAWWAPVFGNPQTGQQLITTPYDVPLYRSKSRVNRYLLLDPYGPTTPFAQYQINVDESKEGYLVFDIAYTSESNIVFFEPFVYSLTMDDEKDGIGQYYCYNIESLYYFIYGNNLDNIEPLFLDRGMDVSYFEESERKVYIYNPVFDELPQSTFASPLGFTNMPGGYINLPENFDSVESIIGEETNGPIEYYNLQGVRILNPTAGQLIIKRQGNKATKLIVR